MTRTWLAILFAFASLSGACSLDFDRFETRALPDPTQDSDVQDLSGDMGPQNDVGEEDAEMVDAEDEETPLVVGAACSSDAECGEGICLDDYCTLECSRDTECPEGSTCRELGGVAACAADCSEFACDGVGDRDDLSCVFAITTAGDYERSCLLDSDGDTIPDVDDPCPEDPEGRELDSDGDGVGDACDDEPYCLPGHDEGVIEVGEFDDFPDGFSLPDYIEGRVIPMWGGRVDGAPVADVRSIELTRDATVEQLDDLPRTGVEFASAPQTGGWVLTPGATEAGSAQLGRMIEVRVSGAETGRVFDEVVYEPTLLTLDSGHLFLHGFTQEDPGSQWRVWLWNEDSATFLLRALGSAGDRTKFRSFTDGRGTGYFYSQTRDEFQRSYIVRVRANQTQSRTVTWPEEYDFFDPFMTAGVGGSIWVHERTDGTAWSLNLDELTPEPVPALDLELSYDETRWVALTGGPGFAVFGRTAGGPWEVTAYSMACMPAAIAIDTDEDGVPDVIDNCPVDSNGDQEDLDADGIGDVCDDDTDGDGIPDDDDFIEDSSGVRTDLSRDSDNDGVDNADDDDADGDGIPDSVDRWLLDTDNDRVKNKFDTDSDGDGYSDAVERNGDTNPFDPLSFPGGGNFAWVEDDGASPVVRMSSLESDRAVVDVMTMLDSPRQVRIQQGPRLLVLSNSDLEAIEYVDLESEMAEGLDTGTPVEEVDFAPDFSPPLGPLSLVARVEAAGSSNAIVTFDTDEGFAERVIVFDAFETLSGPRAWSNGFAFLAQPPGCQACTVLFEERGSLRAVGLAEPLDPLAVGVAQSGRVISAMDAEGSLRLFRVSGTTVQEIPSEGWEAIDSIAPLEIDGSLIVSAKRAGESFDLWFYNGRVERWHRLVESDADLISVDWGR